MEIFSAIIEAEKDGKIEEREYTIIAPNKDYVVDEVIKKEFEGTLKYKVKSLNKHECFIMRMR